jgi:D-alanine-D-alanine ligase
VTLADDRQTYTKGLDEVFATRRVALVERRIFGRELTVGVLHTEGLPVVEIVPQEEFYNYQAKYFDDRTEYVVNPALPPGVEQQVRRIAAAAHGALGCRDFSRVDLLLDRAGGPFVLEVNTIPGFTTHSLLPKSAAAAGIDFPALCRYIVELALWRRPGSLRRGRARQGPGRAGRARRS